MEANVDPQIVPPAVVRTAEAVGVKNPITDTPQIESSVAVTNGQPESVPSEHRYVDPLSVLKDQNILPEAAQGSGSLLVDPDDYVTVYTLDPDGRISRYAYTVPQDGKDHSPGYLRLNFQVHEGKPGVIILHGDKNDPVLAEMRLTYDTVIGYAGNETDTYTDFADESLPEFASRERGNEPNPGARNSLFSPAYGPERIETDVIKRQNPQQEETPSLQPAAPEGETAAITTRDLVWFEPIVAEVPGNPNMREVTLTIKPGYDIAGRYTNETGQMQVLHVDQLQSQQEPVRISFQTRYDGKNPDISLVASNDQRAEDNPVDDTLNIIREQLKIHGQVLEEDSQVVIGNKEDVVVTWYAPRSQPPENLSATSTSEPTGADVSNPSQTIKITVESQADQLAQQTPQTAEREEIPEEENRWTKEWAADEQVPLSDWWNDMVAKGWISVDSVAQQYAGDQLNSFVNGTNLVPNSVEYYKQGHPFVGNCATQLQELIAKGQGHISVDPRVYDTIPGGTNCQIFSKNQ